MISWLRQLTAWAKSERVSDALAGPDPRLYCGQFKQRVAELIATRHKFVITNPLDSLAERAPLQNRNEFERIARLVLMSEIIGKMILYRLNDQMVEHKLFAGGEAFGGVRHKHVVATLWQLEPDVKRLLPRCQEALHDTIHGDLDALRNLLGELRIPDQDIERMYDRLELPLDQLIAELQPRRAHERSESSESDDPANRLPAEAPLEQPPEEVHPMSEHEGPEIDTNKGDEPRSLVFVVHGRNERLRKDFFSFLRAVGLNPLEWNEAIAHTGTGSPYIGDVLDAAFSRVQAVVVLLTPDDEVRLAEEFWKIAEDPREKTLLRQPRPNVLFEAGMAFGRHPDKTILVEVGSFKAFSDVSGRHTVRLDNSAGRRMDVVERLKQAGCAVTTDGRDWLEVGNLTA